MVPDHSMVVMDRRERSSRLILQHSHATREHHRAQQHSHFSRGSSGIPGPLFDGKENELGRIGAGIPARIMGPEGWEAQHHHAVAAVVHRQRVNPASIGPHHLSSLVHAQRLGQASADWDGGSGWPRHGPVASAQLEGKLLLEEEVRFRQQQSVGLSREHLFTGYGIREDRDETGKREFVSGTSRGWDFSLLGAVEEDYRSREDLPRIYNRSAIPQPLEIASKSLIPPGFGWEEKSRPSDLVSRYGVCPAPRLAENTHPSFAQLHAGPNASSLPCKRIRDEGMDPERERAHRQQRLSASSHRQLKLLETLNPSASLHRQTLLRGKEGNEFGKTLFIPGRGDQENHEDGQLTPPPALSSVWNQGIESSSPSLRTEAECKNSHIMARKFSISRNRVFHELSERDFRSQPFEEHLALPRKSESPPSSHAKFSLRSSSYKESGDSVRMEPENRECMLVANECASPLSEHEQRERVRLSTLSPTKCSQSERLLTKYDYLARNREPPTIAQSEQSQWNRSDRLSKWREGGDQSSHSWKRHRQDEEICEKSRSPNMSSTKSRQRGSPGSKNVSKSSTSRSASNLKRNAIARKSPSGRWDKISSLTCGLHKRKEILSLQDGGEKDLKVSVRLEHQKKTKTTFCEAKEQYKVVKNQREATDSKLLPGQKVKLQRSQAPQIGYEHQVLVQKSSTTMSTRSAKAETVQTADGHKKQPSANLSWAPPLIPTNSEIRLSSRSRNLWKASNDLSTSRVDGIVRAPSPFVTRHGSASDHVEIHSHLDVKEKQYPSRILKEKPGLTKLLVDIEKDGDIVGCSPEPPCVERGSANLQTTGEASQNGLLGMQSQNCVVRKQQRQGLSSGKLAQVLQPGEPHEGVQKECRVVENCLESLDLQQEGCSVPTNELRDPLLNVTALKLTTIKDSTQNIECKAITSKLIYTGHKTDLKGANCQRHQHPLKDIALSTEPVLEVTEVQQNAQAILLAVSSCVSDHIAYGTLKSVRAINQDEDSKHGASASEQALQQELGHQVCNRDPDVRNETISPKGNLKLNLLLGSGSPPKIIPMSESNQARVETQAPCTGMVNPMSESNQARVETQAPCTGIVNPLKCENASSCSVVQSLQSPMLSSLSLLDCEGQCSLSGNARRLCSPTPKEVRLFGTNLNAPKLQSPDLIHRTDEQSASYITHPPSDALFGDKEPAVSSPSKECLKEIALSVAVAEEAIQAGPTAFKEPVPTEDVPELHHEIVPSCLSRDKVVMDIDADGSKMQELQHVLQDQEDVLNPPLQKGATAFQQRLSSTTRLTGANTWHRGMSTKLPNVFKVPMAVIPYPYGQSAGRGRGAQVPAYVRKGNSLVRASGSSSIFQSTHYLKNATSRSSSVPVKSRTRQLSVVKQSLSKNSMSISGHSNKKLDIGQTKSPSLALEFSTPIYLRPQNIGPGMPARLRVARCGDASTPATSQSRRPQTPPNVGGNGDSYARNLSVSLVDQQAVGSLTQGSLISNHNEATDDISLTAENSDTILCSSSSIEPPMSFANSLSSMPISGSRFYMRSKANQLVAAATSPSKDLILPTSQSKQAGVGGQLQDLYIKRKTNQLVRNNVGTVVVSRSLGHGHHCSGSVRDTGDDQRQTRSASFGSKKAVLGRVFTQRKLPGTRSSWVWTLNGENGAPTTAAAMLSQKATPVLFPWKRHTLEYVSRLRRPKMLPEGKKGSFLFYMSKRLRKVRTVQPVYTRSAHGFALHRSGVLSIRGANLKWTKSLEKRAKQVSEVATKAVAAEERKKRENIEARAGAATAVATAKANKRAGRKASQAGGERVVWVGLVRYLMDSGRKTLQRLPDITSSTGLVDSTAGLTPKRSNIGGTVYLRVGNGNQLVRDPKAASRALASEKVRWSLHNARFRRAKKQQYCQFFTRFGKCNKESGKCLYIHDPEKVAVCTKFLKGTCAESNCPLTHKVIPERMPDCSYFLQGLCTNENCPYRHVNVNPKASNCDGFLRGYCSKGDKCKNKHTYVCPNFAESGECPDRLTCKLHHPKRKSNTIAPLDIHRKEAKRKCRYFSSMELSSRHVVSELNPRQGEATLYAKPHEDCLEFISLNSVDSDDDEEVSKLMLQASRPKLSLKLVELASRDDVERLIKPAFLFHKESLLPTV